MNKNSTYFSILLGVIAAVTVAATTDQIWQSVYNSTANALQVSIVGSSGTPVPTAATVPTATPQPTATPRATDTPAPTPTPPGALTGVTNLSYSGSLNVTGSTSIAASATPTTTDRNIYCTSGSSAITYTMPAATGTGRVIDVWKIDAAGSGTCVLGRAGSDTLNGATTLTLGASAIGHETCIDKASTVWLCAGAGT